MSETTSNEADAPCRTHRVYSLELKQQIVLETLQPGSSVSAVARKHGKTLCIEGFGTTLGTRLSSAWRGPHEVTAITSHRQTRLCDRLTRRLLAISRTSLLAEHRTD